MSDDTQSRIPVTTKAYAVLQRQLFELARVIRLFPVEIVRDGVRGILQAGESFPAGSPELEAFVRSKHKLELLDSLVLVLTDAKTKLVILTDKYTEEHRDEVEAMQRPSSIIAPVSAGRIVLAE